MTGERPIALYAPGSDGTPTGFGRVTHRLRQLPRVVGRAVRHPAWLVETVRGIARRRQSAKLAFRLADHADHFVEPADAVARATGATEAEAAAALGSVWTPLDDDLGGHPLYGARRELAQIVAAVVTLGRPSVVVETGVAQGVTTASILRALPDGSHLPRSTSRSLMPTRTTSSAPSSPTTLAAGDPCRGLWLRDTLSVSCGHRPGPTTAVIEACGRSTRSECLRTTGRGCRPVLAAPLI